MRKRIDIQLYYLDQSFWWILCEKEKKAWGFSRQSWDHLFRLTYRETTTEDIYKEIEDYLWDYYMEQEQELERQRWERYEEEEYARRYGI